jgi:hypothetical protein
VDEAAWLSGDDPVAMIDFFRLRSLSGRVLFQRPPSLRKLRLIGCACCRYVWHELHEAARRAIEVSEEWADGKTDLSHLLKVRNDRPLSIRGKGDPNEAAGWCAYREIDDHINFVLSQTSREEHCPPVVQASIVRDIIGNPWRPARITDFPSGDPDLLNHAVLTPTILSLATAAYNSRDGSPCLQCRGRGEVFVGREADDDQYACANCGRAAGQYGHWLPGDRWACPRQECWSCHGTGRFGIGLLDNDRLAVLADALEEAGVPDGNLLRHLRGWKICPDLIEPPEGGQKNSHVPGYWVRDWWCHTPSPTPAMHARGCWALDLILERE